MIPIPKGFKKELTNNKNYRGIALTPDPGPSPLPTPHLHHLHPHHRNQNTDTCATLPRSL